MTRFGRESFLCQTAADTLCQLQESVKAGLDKSYRDMMRDLIEDANKVSSMRDVKSHRPNRPGSPKGGRSRPGSGRRRPQSASSRPASALRPSASQQGPRPARPVSGRSRKANSSSSNLLGLSKAGETSLGPTRPVSAATQDPGAWAKPLEGFRSDMPAVDTTQWPPRVGLDAGLGGQASSGSNSRPSSRPGSRSGLMKGAGAAVVTKNFRMSVKDLPELAGVARKHNLSLETCREASELFKPHANIADGSLDKAQIVQITKQVTSAQNVNGDMAAQAFHLADKDASSATLTFPEFTLWYATLSFDENVNCTDEEKEFRALCRRHNMDLASVERYRRNFDAFDVDKDGSLGEEEFGALVRKCAKVPERLEIPAARFRQLWKEADSDGSGDIDFEEFLQFYTRFFNESADGGSGFESFYRNVRPALGTGW